MARTYTNLIPLKFKAPDFSLPCPELENIEMTLNELKGEKGTIIMFICNHCPFVIHVIDEIVEIAIDFNEKEFEFIAINSNDIEKYPDDSPEKMIEFSEKYDLPFAYLFDESQEVAKAYHAACTPEFSVFDKDLICVYRGQMDDSRPGNDEEINGKDIRTVLNAIIEGTEIPQEQKPSLGCNIKWKE